MGERNHAEIPDYLFQKLNTSSFCFEVSLKMMMQGIFSFSKYAWAVKTDLSKKFAKLKYIRKVQNDFD